MLTKEQAIASVTPRPQSYAALMEMYEYNYIQLRLLLGDLWRMDEHQIGRSAGDHLPLSVEIKERTRHTLTLMLTYHFHNEQGEVIEQRPDLLIRVYQDALQAEVITHKCKFSDQRVRHWWKKPESMLLCRWRMNRFLFKWLRYLQNKGYTFCTSND